MADNVTKLEEMKLSILREKYSPQAQNIPEYRNELEKREADIQKDIDSIKEQIKDKKEEMEYKTRDPRLRSSFGCIWSFETLTFNPIQHVINRQILNRSFA